MNLYRNIAIFTLLVATQKTHCTVSAHAPDEACETTFPHRYDSGNTKTTSTTIFQTGAEWIQLDLSRTRLARNAKLLIIGDAQPRETQELEARALERNGHSAVFDGSSVALELVTPRSLRGEGFPSRVVISAVRAGLCDDRDAGNSISPIPAPNPAPTSSPISTPTFTPTSTPTSAPTHTHTRAPTPSPTFLSCSQFDEGACPGAHGGGVCQWLGGCHNCGCGLMPRA